MSAPNPNNNNNDNDKLNDNQDVAPSLAPPSLVPSLAPPSLSAVQDFVDDVSSSVVSSVSQYLSPEVVPNVVPNVDPDSDTAYSYESVPYAPNDRARSSSSKDSDGSYVSKSSWYGPKYSPTKATPEFIKVEEDGSYYVENEHEKDFSDYYDAIDNYYRYKTQYETAKRLEQATVMRNNPTASWTTKRNLYKLKKTACINCKRRVGTIFSTDYATATEFLKVAPRVLKAACGDTTSPCALDIQIMIPNTTTFDEPISKTKEIIKQLQNDIIKEKNDAIFGYTPKEVAIQNFKQTTGALSVTIERYENIISLHEYITNNIKQNKLLTDTQIAFYNNIGSLNNYISEFKKTNDDQFIGEAVSLYIDELIVQSEEIMQNTYSISTVEFDPKDTTFQLFQQKINLPKNQVSLRANTKIIKYVIDDQNVVANKKPKPATKPTMDKMVPNTNTRLVIQESSDNSDNSDNSNKLSLSTNSSKPLSEISSE
jgi:hypothetical protein